MKKFFATLSLVFVAGCSSMGDYYKSVDSANSRQVEMALAASKAEEARYNALASIANSGDSTAKVAATMALALGAQATRHAGIAVPSVPQNEALQWASILVPGVTQLGMGFYNMRQGMRASDNATTLGLSTNATFSTLGSQIAKDPLVVEQPEYNDPIIVQPVVVNPVVVEQPEYNDPIIVQPAAQN